MAVDVIFVITCIAIFGLLHKQQITSMLKPIFLNIPTYLGLTMDNSQRYLIEHKIYNDEDDFMLSTNDYANDLSSQPSICNMRDWNLNLCLLTGLLIVTITLVTKYILNSRKEAVVYASGDQHEKHFVDIKYCKNNNVVSQLDHHDSADHYDQKTDDTMITQKDHHDSADDYFQRTDLLTNISVTWTDKSVCKVEWHETYENECGDLTDNAIDEWCESPK